MEDVQAVGIEPERGGILVEKRGSLLNEELRLLAGKELKISKDQEGNLGLEIKGELYDKIEVKRTFPYSYKDKYILLKDKEGKEIGILEYLAELESESRQLLEEELEKVYYIPQIQQVLNIEYRMRTPIWTVKTDRGRVSFELARRSDAKFINARHLVIKDAAGSRYEVLDYSKLDARSQELIEREV
ncbi:MAG TPA: DUF1854 domain-containing protein [Halanaerobiaceae bacterium]|jgi:hypothetical protein|nr:DUF1854 domain-containing protein [Bacillota bacterium]HHU92500.1 DUF1854 domain-containing protein [Halanaerobiaceae bacterium]HOA41779.1 DUF1854 domain-containing protein [Halanaerobiales bacterium]HPZ62888.1 DUF1854 domain-containing protein [Halanaerobiales bacterium]HQD04113.1 DUF1854 domain-containing protein [Halanaerobiales bacterium]